ncbi:MAG: winged helix DNA-binding domain-containing protein [Clostridiales bacterium]|nr:winged helix DNA-binding domain-containing protein [Clostridiales bacterium]
MSMNNTPIKITKEQLRNFYINYHFGNLFDLSEQTAIESIMDRIQTIQFDPLNVAGRNAELVLFSRNRNVTRETLYNALYRSRTLVDGWDKMMSIFPTKFFPHFKHVREQSAKQYECWMSWRKQQDCYPFMDEVYSYIQQHGPVLVTDIPSQKTNNCNWGPSKVAGVCCEYLWNAGKISVADKKGVVKYYDTTEKLFGELAEKTVFRGEHEFLLWYVKRRIAAVGAVWDKNGGAWLGLFIEKSDGRTPIINELTERGEILSVQVEGEKTPFYICREAVELLDAPPPEHTRAILVAPLDNMIWDRKLIKNIFDFDYSWEVYVPATKRKFGYYVLPIIIGNRFVGRLEPMQYKPNEKFTIKNIWWEQYYTPTDTDIDLIAAELNRLARFLGVEIDPKIKNKISG